MNKTKLATAFILMLLFSTVVGVPMIKVAKANPHSYFLLFWRDINVIRSPQNKTYNGAIVPINFTVEYLPASEYPFGTSPSPLSRYILENIELGQSQVVEVTLENTSIAHKYQVATTHYAKYDGSHFSNLAASTYKFTVQRYSEEGGEITVRSSASVIFSVNPAIPDISDLTIENKTYPASNIPFTFIVGEPVEQITYSLDNQRNVTLSGNTLTGLPEGSHNLTIYATDFDGNTGSSETAYFTVDTIPPTVDLLLENVFHTSEIPLNYKVSEPVEQVTYSLNKQENFTIKGNTTLTIGPDGPHNLTVYAKGFDGNTGSSGTKTFIIDTPPPKITVTSLKNISYWTSEIFLNFIVDEPVEQITYSLDEQEPVTLDGNTTLKDVPDGSHTLTIYAKSVGGHTGSSETIAFTVDTKVPNIVLMLENTTYYTSKIPLTFTIDEVKSQIDWKGYTLDSQAYVTISRNVTLRDLSDGAHNLTVYVRDMSGNVGSSSIYFTIDTVNQPAESVETTSQEAESADALNPKAEQLPTTSDVTPIVVVAALSLASLGLLVYFTKIKKTSKPEK